MTFSVRVVDSDGDPRSGVRVYVNYGLMNGGATEYTDDDGWAVFEPSGDYSSAEIYVDGDCMGDYGIEDGETFSFS
jgi:hypothetical protein